MLLYIFFKTDLHKSNANYAEIQINTIVKFIVH
jgi:hypothetical protein